MFPYLFTSHLHGYPISHLIIPIPHRLKPFEDEEVRGEMRVQITYEHYKVCLHFASHVRCSRPRFSIDEASLDTP